MNLERIDTETLTQIINLCFDLSTSGGVPDDLQVELRALGKRLRGTLVNLLSVQFDANTPKFIEASQKLKAVNASLKQAAENLAKIADTVEQIGKLVGTLDDLLTIAVSFA